MTAIRGLLHRSRATILIFILAAVGAAAAAAGPAYYQAAKVSILRDEFSSSLFVDSGFEASASGSVAGLLAPTSINVHGDLVFYLGPLARQHLFAPEVDSIESSVNVGAYGGVPIVQNKPRWRPSAERPALRAARCVGGALRTTAQTMARCRRGCAI